ncbi:signal peptidase I [Pontiella sulfatireligans]|uniref:Signal peptidase I n=1 Tax=Pontiella sulfatireligans TaxID=2750658 RepID=A0A6C2UIY5_9BACT|nr:signal peptidase I [Pontiella sulfatireligans]VGO19843.1 Signal peptidase I V [Pontiella sulfatireligans]
MDMSRKKEVYPRWIGIIFGLLLPGSAHYLSGAKTAGLAWLAVITVMSTGSSILILVPSSASIQAGLAGTLVAVVLNLVMIATSYRPVKRLSFKGWAGVIGCLLLYTLRLEPLQTASVSADSMAPTLQGLRTEKGDEQTTYWDRVVRGRSYQEFKTEATGTVEGPARLDGENVTFSISNVTHRVPSYAFSFTNMWQHYDEGDVLWSGTVTAQDYLAVNPYAYILHPPRRGDVIAFLTDGIEHPAVNPGATYVKRVAGVPGDRIRIEPPSILINGKPLVEPEIFQHFSYEHAGLLSNPTNYIKLAQGEYFVVGDNTGFRGSLDGRYFGAIREESIVGKVKSIYWPLPRIGGVE